MNRPSTVQLLTLWFADMAFIQTASESASNPMLTVAVLFALVLMYAVPLYLVVRAVAAVVRWRESDTA